MTPPEHPYSQPRIKPYPTSTKHTIRTTFQLTGDILGRNDLPIDRAYKAILNTSLRWIQQRFPEKLPPEAFEDRDFKLETPLQSIDCISLHEDGWWAARLTHPDAPFGTQVAVPGRTWTTEVTYHRQPTSIRYGIRLYCASLPYATQEISLSRPRIVTDLATNFILLDGRPLDGQPWILSTEDELLFLKDFLVSPGRNLPVYLLTEPDEYALGLKVDKYLLKHDRLAYNLLGLGHVIVLPRNLEQAWINLVGKSWATFRGAVRTYKQGLNFDIDPLSQHPLALPQRILAFSYEELKAEEAFTKFLIDQAYLDSAFKKVNWPPCQFLSDARTRRIALSRTRLREEKDWLGLYEQEIASLKEKIEALERESEAFNDDAINAQRERDYYIQETRLLRASNEQLRRALSAKTSQSPDTAVPILNSYNDLSDWVEEHLIGRLELHPRARKGLKDARYEEVELVYKALLLLANEYRDMKLGLENSKQEWEAAVSRLGLDYRGAITRERAGEQGDTYFVRYPLHGTDKRFLDFHLRKGTSRDERYCLAIYFFWDSESQQVVVGWLPSHLENRLT